jgi:hypothetical protein
MKEEKEDEYEELGRCHHPYGCPHKEDRNCNHSMVYSTIPGVIGGYCRKCGYRNY